MTNKKKKNSENWIYSYYQKIKDGTETVGKYIETILEYLVHGIEEKLFFYNQKKANKAIDWIEKHAFHTEGKLAPNPLELELWEKALVSAIFGIVDENGKRQFHEVLLLIGRKNGKSLLAAAIIKYAWWEDGGFGAKIYNIAPKLDQADIIYNNVWQMTLLDPEYKRLKEELSDRDEHNKKIKDDSMLPKHRMSDLYILGTNSTVKKISFDAKRSDGFNPSVCVCDEIAAWDGEKGLKAYEVMKSGMGTREEPLLISCTTAGYVNDSIYDELIKRATRFLKGDGKEKKLLPFLYIIDDIEKWNDINELRKANPQLGKSISVDFMLEQIAIAEGSLSKKKEFLCKHCNIKQNSSQAWLDAVKIDKCFGEALHLEDFSRCYAVGGIDLSQTTDLTAATLIIEKNGILNVFAKFWLPAERIEEAQARDGVPYDIYLQKGWLETSGESFVDYHDCQNWFVDILTKYKIYPLKVGYDRYSAQYLVQEMRDIYSFHMDDVYQGTNLTPVIRETEGLLNDGKFNFGDNQLLKIHLLNSALKNEVEMNKVRLVKISGKEHIDGTAALLDAMCVRQKWWSEIGNQLQNTSR